ncbi:MAG: aldehyde ferredoxin oxidoreductase family protein [Candidatus Thorarchaeota archaeon]|jgi:aldehyde:ferredoxin oxidoreductase
MTHECWNGKVLWVDLTTGVSREEDIDNAIYETFIGGKGLGSYLLYNHVKASIDPLGPENVLFFMTGPLQGLPAPSVARWALVTKSPMTGLFLDSYCGGPLGREIKNAGYDALCVTGKSKKPCLILIEGDSVQIMNADNIWGEGIHTATEKLHERFSSKHAVYVIGPAGENLVTSACGACEIAHQTGRGGSGAVLGSKNLKGVVVKGEKKIQAFDVSAIRQVNKEYTTSWNALDIDFKKYGTRHLVEVANEVGQFPFQNWKSGYFDEFEKLDHVIMEEKYGIGNHQSCPNCVMRCTHAFRTEHPEKSGFDVESTIEYESLGIMGGDLGISDVPTVLKLNFLCDDLGLDTISAGSAIGFAMEAFEKGILTVEDIGFPLNFGDGEAALKLLRMIAELDGFGAILAKGVREAAKEIGKSSEDFAVHIKGMEVPAWDPRGRKGQAFLYVTSEIGASHLRGWPPHNVPPDSPSVDIVEKLVESRIDKMIKDTLIICHFTNRVPITMEQMIRALNGASGLEYDEEKIAEWGRRIETMSRLFNVREGISRKDDSLPKRFLEPQINGPRKGMTSYISEEDFQDSLSRFYEIMGWDSDGRPTKSTLEELGLSEFV